MTITRKLIAAILQEYELPIDGFHGPVHWARVLETGLRLAEATGANRDVVQLFAVFHDAKRFSEGTDYDHGQRGADHAAELLGTAFELPDPEFDLLYQACAEHELGFTDADITVQVCWDADRLDLGRVGIDPSPAALCTHAARSHQMLAWANRRARSDHIPSFVADEWGIYV